LGEILAQEVQKKAPQGVTGAINAKVCSNLKLSIFSHLMYESNNYIIWKGKKLSYNNVFFILQYNENEFVLQVR
jgi:hypothetical protein